ncbi:MAG: ABC transporter ATP-binding protein [Clostridia bacterium]|nr:ABC transporter ATP-binding protein [Clostridia bacterium]
MLEITQYSSTLNSVLDNSKITPEDILLFTRIDMDKELIKSDTYLFITKDSLFIVEGLNAIEGQTGFSIKRNRLKLTYCHKNTESYELSQYKDFSVEELISTGRLIAKKGDESVCLAIFTNACKADVRLFVKYLNMYQKDGKIEKDEGDFKKDNFCPKCHSRYPDSNRKICPKCMDKGKLVRRMWIFIRKYIKEMLLVLFALILVSAIGVIAPYFSSRFFYDKILDENSSFYGQILFMIGIIVVLNLCSIGINIISNVITAKIAGKLVYDMKRTIFDSIKRLSLSFFTGRQTGGLMTQIDHDASSIYWFFVDGLPYFLINIVQVIVVFIVMLTINPMLAVLCMSVVPIFLFMISRLYRHSGHLHMKNYSCQRAMNSVLADVLSGMRVVKAFAREKEESSRFGKHAERSTQMYKQITVYNNTAYPVATQIMSLSSTIVWLVGGWLVMNGNMTYGTLVLFLSYVGMINSPLFMFVDMTHFFSHCMNGVQRLFEIYDAEPEVTEKENAIKKDSLDGHVQFSNVVFSYDKSRRIIDDVSFDIEPGKMIGIVGHSGAGKSTLANLLIRLYDVSEGQITIDGVNVKDYSFDTLRKNIAIVSQETYLFIGSILENIRYAKPDATKEEIIQAAKIAGAHDFIVKLPDGYNTQIGLGYKDLSGGERQRISIARAVLLNPKILILDEATAAMDTETERKIQTALEKLIVGKTTIVIAHRLSTLRDADKLIVIENGKMPEFGTHGELIRQKGIYYKLYMLQLEALKNVGVAE